MTDTLQCGPDAPLFDLRAERVPSRPKIKMAGKRPVVRYMPNVTGVTIHQTAIVYGVSAAQLRAAGGDRRLALARRALNVACHALAFRDGFFVASTPLSWYVQHGNGLNATTLGLEIDGLYSGLCDDPRTTPRREDLETTWGGEPCELTPAIVEAGRSALRWLVIEGRREGMPIGQIWAHRQSSAARRSDPGEELWQSVAEPVAAELGLRIDYAATLGSGRPIPVQWSAAHGVGRY